MMKSEVNAIQSAVVRIAIQCGHAIGVLEFLTEAAADVAARLGQLDAQVDAGVLDLTISPEVRQRADELAAHLEMVSDALDSLVNVGRAIKNSLPPLE